MALAPLFGARGIKFPNQDGTPPLCMGSAGVLASWTLRKSHGVYLESRHCLLVWGRGREGREVENPAAK